MHLAKLSKSIDPTQVVNKTMNKTHPSIRCRFGVVIVVLKANAITPLFDGPATSYQPGVPNDLQLSNV